MKPILSLLYKLNKNAVLDIVAKDFYGEIPKDVAEPAIILLKEQKTIVKRFFFYQAFLVQRRIAKTKDETHSLFGMLIQIKLALHALERGIFVPENSDGTKPAAFADEERKKRESLEKDLEGVEKFKTKKSTPK